MLEQIVKHVNLTGLAGATRNFKDRLYKEKIFFAHVPKSGGTSLSHMLRAKYPLSFFKLDEHASRLGNTDRSLGEWMQFKSDLMRYHAESGVHYIQGHAPVNENFVEEFSDKYNFITLIRHPVDRMVSHYFFDKRLSAMSPDEFLASQKGFTASHVLAHFFGSLCWDTPEDVDAATARALKVLNSFSCVGILEEPEQFSNALKNSVGLKLKIPRRNIGQDRKDNVFTPEHMARINEMCAQDLHIYNCMKDKLANATAAG
ncbi:MAG: sulfotransferase family 2 domain-containing protein [Hyphomonas sp.]